MTAVTAAQLLKGLTGHYVRSGDDRNGEILLTEVLAPGSSGRRCDLLRVGLWPSRGLGIDVHEIKISRPDWLRELDDPAKAEAWWPFCSRFWITAPRGVVQPAELPDGWGLLEPPTQEKYRRFRTVVKPATKEPKLTVLLLATIFGRLENMRLNELRNLRSDHDNAVFQAVQRDRAERITRGIPEEMRRRLELLDRLETAAGVRLDSYAWTRNGTIDTATPEELGAALADVRAGVAAHRRIHAVDDRIGQLRRALERLNEDLNDPWPDVATALSAVTA